MTPQQKIVSQLIKQCPNAGAATLAKRAYKEFPESFQSLDSARCAFRRAFGAHGDKHRKNATHPRRPRTGKMSFPALPKPLRHFNKWDAFVIKGPCKAVLLSDIHIPYHDRRALDCALGHAAICAVDLIILNGDVADFHRISRWEKDPRKRPLADEVKSVKQFLGVLRDGFRDARIILKLGNHEERWENYLQVKAPELLGIEDYELSKVLGLDALNIEIVSDKRPILLGKLYVIHGHEFMRSTIAAPVNPARGFFLRAQTHVIGGHHHQTSQHSQKNLGQNVISAWSTGALCEMHPDYAPINNWNHGFAVVHVFTNGAFEVQNLRIVKGKVWQ